MFRRVPRVSALALALTLSLASPLAFAQTDAGVSETPPPPPAVVVAPEPVDTPAQIQARIHYDQSRAHYAAGHYRAAARELEAAVTIDPEGANLWFNLGNVCERLGDLDRARVAYQRYMDRTRDAVEQERTRRILTRLDGAQEELQSLRRRHGRADGAFWALTGAAIGATGFGVAWLLSSTDNDTRVAPWAFTVGGVSLGVLATVLYFAREAPRGRSLLVDVSPDGRVSLSGRF
jgi:tetratricopeptide (TPR) repeat protein